VKVEWTFFADDPEAFAKIQSGYEADLVHPSSSWLRLYVENDLLQPIDTSRLSNWSKLDEDLVKMGQVDGVQYMAPWEWGYNSILVRCRIPGPTSGTPSTRGTSRSLTPPRPPCWWPRRCWASTPTQ